MQLYWLCVCIAAEYLTRHGQHCCDKVGGSDSTPLHTCCSVSLFVPFQMVAGESILSL